MFILLPGTNSLSWSIRTWSHHASTGFGDDKMRLSVGSCRPCQSYSTSSLFSDRACLAYREALLDGYLEVRPMAITSLPTSYSNLALLSRGTPKSLASILRTHMSGAGSKKALGLCHRLFQSKPAHRPTEFAATMPADNPVADSKTNSKRALLDCPWSRSVRS